MHKYFPQFPFLVYSQLMLYAFCKIPSSTIQKKHKIVIFTSIFIYFPLLVQQKERRNTLKRMESSQWSLSVNFLLCDALKLFATCMSRLGIMKSEILLILRGTRQLLVYAGDAHTSGGNTHTTNKNTEALVVVSKEIGLDAHAEKTKCYDQVSGLTRRKNKIKMRNKFFEGRKSSYIWKRR